MTLKDLRKVYPMFDLIDKGSNLKHAFMRYQAITKRAEGTTLHCVAESVESLADQLAFWRSKNVK